MELNEFLKLTFSKFRTLEKLKFLTKVKELKKCLHLQKCITFTIERMGEIDFLLKKKIMDFFYKELQNLYYR